MLKELRIRNLAIIEDLVVRFEKGLNVLTGETGAGKSIIVDALGLALGARAQSDMIKSGEKEAAVQAFFELDSYDQLPDVGIDFSEGLMLRRVLSSGGKSRAYINDTMVTLQTLSEIGKSLVDVHSQHEHQSLLTQEKQRTLLDSYGKLNSEREKVGAIFSEVKALRAEMEGLKEKSRERAHRVDLLKFQVDEIDSASLKGGEKEALEEEKGILSNCGRLNELAGSAYSLLYESDGSCSERLSAAISNIREISAIDNAAEEILRTLESAVPLIEDATIFLRGYRERHDSDPARLEFLHERLELISKLEKKYGEGTEEVLNYRDRAEEELRLLEDTDERISSLEQQLTAREKELLAAAEKLSGGREKTGRKIEELICDNLRELAFSNAVFRIEISRERGKDGEYVIKANGVDRIEFLFSANPGEPLKPLSRIISGGELSRVMLALKSILADVDSMPVLIFDEVDAGIGGRTAESVGKKLDVIARNHQLLCITHLPQIASYGDMHLKIEKRETGSKVRVEIRELRGKERRDEIARMLSGKITDISLQHAGELLERVK